MNTQHLKLLINTCIEFTSYKNNVLIKAILLGYNSTSIQVELLEDVKLNNSIAFRGARKMFDFENISSIETVQVMPYIKDDRREIEREWKSRKIIKANRMQDNEQKLKSA